jgi:hypothetical protein
MHITPPHHPAPPAPLSSHTLHFPSSQTIHLFRYLLKPPHHTSPIGQDSPVSRRHFRYSNIASPPSRTVDAFVLSQGPGYGKYSPISTGRSFLASIPILTPVLPLKILKRFFPPVSDPQQVAYQCIFQENRSASTSPPP